MVSLVMVLPIALYFTAHRLTFALHVLVVAVTGFTFKLITPSHYK